MTTAANVRRSFLEVLVLAATCLQLIGWAVIVVALGAWCGLLAVARAAVAVAGRALR